MSAARGELAKNFPGLDAMLKPRVINEDREEGNDDVGGTSPPVTAESVTPIALKKKAPARKAKAAPVVEVCCCTTVVVVLAAPAIFLVSSTARALLAAASHEPTSRCHSSCTLPSSSSVLSTAPSI
jgi:hypothetical protein